MADLCEWTCCGCDECAARRLAEFGDADATAPTVERLREQLREIGDRPMANFVNITREEMRDFILSGKRKPDRWETAGKEQVAVWTIWLVDRNGGPERKPSGLEVKLYTSFAKDADEARECGSDAIRVVLVSNGGKSGHRYPHVKRVAGWRDNLRTRLHEAFADANRKLRGA